MTGSIEVLLPTQLMGVLIAISSQQKKTDIIAFITIDIGLIVSYSVVRHYQNDCKVFHCYRHNINVQNKLFHLLQ